MFLGVDSVYVGPVTCIEELATERVWPNTICKRARLTGIVTFIPNEEEFPRRYI